MDRVKKIIQIAESYLDIIEKPGNTGWFNAKFQTLMIKVGWYNKAPWCAFTTKGVYLEAYADHKAFTAIIKSCFTGGAIDTFNRVKANGTFKTGSTPKPGAIVIWANGKGPAGHAGIVISVDGNNTMTTFEGNTNASGSREGDRTARKLRTVTRPFQPSGLNVVGYIYANQD